MSIDQTRVLRDFRQKLNSRFDESELKNLAFDLSIDWEDLPGKTRSEKTLSLIKKCARNGSLNELLTFIKEEQPDEEWPDISDLEQLDQATCDNHTFPIDEREQEILISKYMREMKDIFLADPNPTDIVKIFARTQTLRLLHHLSGKQKGVVVRFLYEAGLIRMPPTIALNEADLSGVELSGNPEGPYLEEIVLYKVNLSSAVLDGAKLPKAFLNEADLSEASLIGAWLSEAKLQYASLYKADLRLAVMLDVDLWYAWLDGADLRKADLNGACLRSAYLENADLRNADLSSTNLTSFEGATQNGADLSSAELVGANLKEARLNGANLSGANLEGADLTGAQLIGTIVSEKQLSQAKSLESATIIIGKDYDAWLKKPRKEVINSWGLWTKQRIRYSPFEDDH